MRKCRIKAGSLTNLTDARYFNAFPVDLLGFNFDVLHESAVSVTQAKEITGWLHDAPIIGEFGAHQDRQEILFIIQEIDCQAIQVPLERALEIRDRFFLPIYPQIVISSEEEFKEAPALSRHWKREDHPLILTFTGDFSEWPRIRETQHLLNRILQTRQVYLDLELKKEYLEEILETRVYGINLRGRKEERPGWSMVDEYDDILSLLEVE